MDAGGLKFFQAFRHHAPAAQLLPVQEILDLLSALPITPPIYNPVSPTSAPSMQPSSASWQDSASVRGGSSVSQGIRGTGQQAQSGAASSIHTGFTALHLEGRAGSAESRQDDERAIGACARTTAAPWHARARAATSTRTPSPPQTLREHTLPLTHVYPRRLVCLPPPRDSTPRSTGRLRRQSIGCGCCLLCLPGRRTEPRG